MISPEAPPLGTCRSVSKKGVRRRRRPSSILPFDRSPFAVIHCCVASTAPEPDWILCRLTGALEADNDSYIALDYSRSIVVKGDLSLEDWIKAGLVRDMYSANQDDDYSFQLQIDVVPKKNPQREESFFAPLHQSPLPALSVSVTLTSSPIDPDRSTVSNLQEQPLLQSCLKRQLVGCPYLYDSSRNISTQIQLTLQNQHWTFTVASSVCAKQQQQGLVLARILPSTRITLLSAYTLREKNTVEGATTLFSKLAICNEVDEEKQKKTAKALSSPARSLLNTILCMIKLHDGDVPRAFLLTGPPGVGKTHAVRLAVQRSGSHLTVLQGSDILAVGHPAEAARELERHFQKAVRQTQRNDNSDKQLISVIFLDECDALLSSSTQSSVSVVEAMLGRLLDQMNSHPSWRRLLVVAATNRIDSFPGSLRRPGRFDREIPLAPPDATTRLQILETLLCPEKSSNDESDCSIPPEQLRDIADACVGYVPADLAALVRRSELLRLTQSSNIREHDPTSVPQREDLLRQAMSDVGASALRDVALKAPPVTTWDHVAGDPGGAKTTLRQAIEWPRTKSGAYTALGLTPPRGILLHGPPGCAKTTLARAAAGASCVAFLSLSPADVYSSSYVGEAEAVIRRAFTLARSAAPCLLFFDEIDAILGSDSSPSGGSHGMGRGTSSSAEARVLSTFLNEMDGVDGSWKDGVLVLGATNRPWTLDAALLRPGRFDKIIYVPPPDYEGRRSIFSMQCSHWQAAGCSIDIDQFADESVSGNMTGAEIVGACRAACMQAFRELGYGSDEKIVLKEEYLVAALKDVQPLLANPVVMEEYRSFEDRRSRLAT